MIIVVVAWVPTRRSSAATAPQSDDRYAVPPRLHLLRTVPERNDVGDFHGRESDLADAILSSAPPTVRNGLDHRKRLVSEYPAITRIRPISASSVGSERSRSGVSNASHASAKSGVTAAVALGGLMIGLRVEDAPPRPA